MFVDVLFDRPEVVPYPLVELYEVACALMLGIGYSVLLSVPALVRVVNLALHWTCWASK